jgi:hypothetical protein
MTINYTQCSKCGLTAEEVPGFRPATWAKAHELVCTGSDPKTQPQTVIAVKVKRRYSKPQVTSVDGKTVVDVRGTEHEPAPGYADPLIDIGKEFAGQFAKQFVKSLFKKGKK